MTASTASPDTVNEHYLDHVVGTSASHEVEASEDIVAGNGIKLLAKGARIEPAVRERLLQHKLRKPLEECVQVVDAVGAEQVGRLAEELLGQQALLAALSEPGRGRSVPASLAALALSPPVRSLLTVYAQHRPGRLQHTVGVAMLALALARRLWPGEIDRHRTLALAGLMHDVGELYIDPAYLRSESRLDTGQWRHVVTHPIVGERVLREMAGAGPAVADAVAQHHERLDGFGYPRGIAAERFTPEGQVLAAAEWLMALADRGAAPLARASMASRLVPGELSPAVLHAVEAAARAAGVEEGAAGGEGALDAIEPRVTRIADTLARFRDTRSWIEERIAQAPPALKAVLEAGLNRMLRIQASFSSTGFDARSPAVLLAELEALGDPKVRVEVATLVGELEWRMRELERESRLRAGLLRPELGAVVDELLGRLKGG